MKRLKLFFACLLMAVLSIGQMWADDTGTITFGSASGSTNINAASVTGDDSQGNTWTITTAGTTSFTPNADYAQIGSSKKPATSVTFTTTLAAEQTISAFSASFGGFSGTAGTVTLKVGNTEVGTGSLNGTTDVTVNATNTTTAGTVLTVTVTDIAKGVKVTSISYTYTSGGGGGGDDTPTPVTVKTLKSIAVSGQTTTYDQFASFSFDGTCTATYSVTIDDVEQDDEEKEVTPTSVTSPDMSTTGVKEVTVSFTDDNVTKTAKYNITVNEHVVTPGAYDITPNNTFFNTTASGSITGTNANLTYTGTQNDITVTYAKGSQSNMYINATQTRAYNGTVMTFSVPSGYNITAIVFTADGTNWAGTHTASVGTMTNNKNWSGTANSITITFGGTCRITGINVTYEAVAPEVTVDPSSLSFDAKQNIAVDGKTFTLEGANLESGLTLAASTGFTVSPTSISAADAMAQGGAEVTVTPATPTATTTPVEGTVTISGGGLASDVEVALSMAVTPTYAVAIAVNDGDMGSATLNGGTASIYVTDDEEIALVATPESGHEFVKWTVSDENIVLDNENAATTTALAGAAGTITANFQEQACTGLAAPTLNGAVAVTYNSATIAWNAVDNADGYVLNIVKHEGGVAVLTDEVIVAPAVSFEKTGLAANTQYDYTVMAVGDGSSYCDESNPTLAGSFTTSDYPAATLSLVENGGTPYNWGSGLKLNSVIALPDELEGLGCTGKVLAGWSSVAVSETDVEPTSNYWAKGAEYTVQSTADVLYAVLATEGEGTTGYQLVDAAPAAGETVIIARLVSGTYYALKSDVTTGALTISDGLVSSPSNDVKWDVASATSGVYLRPTGETATGLHMNSSALKVANGDTNGDIKFTSNGDGSFKATRADDARWIVTSSTNGLGCSATEANAAALYIFKNITLPGAYEAYTTSCKAQLPVLAAPTFSVEAGTYYEAQTITLAATNDAAIYYSLDGNDPTVDAQHLYSEPFTLSERDVVTVKAIAVAEDYENSEVAEATYNINLPYDFADFAALTNKENGKEYVVRGIISEKGTQLYSGKLPYYISANGSTEGQIKCHNGLKLDKAEFTSVNDVNLGDNVTVVGTWSTQYSNLNAGNWMLEYTARVHDSYEIVGGLTSTTFQVGEAFDDAILGNLSVKEVFTNGYEETVAGATFNCGDKTEWLENETSLTVYAKLGDDDLTSKNFGVTVSSATLVSFVLKEGYKTEYYVGDEFVKPTVIATLTDNTHPEAEATACTGYNMSAAGNYTVNVAFTYGDITIDEGVTYQITVKAVFDNEDAPHTVAKAIELIEASAYQAKQSSTDYMWVSGKVSGFNGTSNKNYYISDDGTATGQLYVYSGSYFGGVAFTDANKLHVGDEVILKATILNYNGSTAELTNSQVVSQFRAPEFAFADIVADDEFEVNISEDLTVVPTANSGDAEFTLTSGNPDAVTIVEGKLHAVAEGDAVITATRAATANENALNYKEATITFNVHVIAERTRYTVSFDADGGTGTDPVIANQLPGAPVELPENPYSKESSAFAGWVVNDGEVEITDGQFTMPEGNVTIKATWNVVATCAISFKVNGTEVATANAPQTAEYSLAGVSHPTVPGFTWVGWSETEYADEVENAPAMITTYTPEAGETTKVLYGIYSRLDNSSASYGKYVKATVVAEGDYLIVCEGQNKVFDGSLSTLDASGNTKAATIVDGVLTLENADNYVFVIAAKQGGYSIKSASNMYIGTTSNANSLTTSATDTYTNTISISGGNVDIECSSARLRYNKTSGQERFRYFKSSSYSAQEAIQLYKKDNGATKYTSSPVEKVTITFNANGGEGGCQKAIINKGSELTICAEAPTKTHSEFAGWKNGDDVYEAGHAYTFNADITLTAQWNEAAKYTVTYAKGGDDVTGAAPTDENEYYAGDPVTLVAHGALAKDGYTFQGWKYGSKLYKAGASFTMPAEAVTFVAQWRKASVPVDNMSMVTSASALSNGMQIALGCSYVKDEVSYFVMAGDIASGKSFLSSKSENITLSDGVATYTDAVVVMTLEQVENGWKITKDGTNYLKETSAKNLAWVTENATVWTISFNGNNVLIEGDYATMKYNSASGQERFTTYSSDQKDIQLFGKAVVVTENASISDLGYTDGEAIVASGANVTLTIDEPTTVPSITAKNGATVEVNQPTTAESVVVEDGSKIVANAETTTPTVYFSTSMGSTQVPGSASELGSVTNITLATGGEIIYDLTLGTSMKGVQADPDQWHAFTLPFAVDALNGIYDAETGAKLENEVNYAIMDYHGDIRANGDYGWKKYRGILQPGVFYLMTVDGNTKTFRFKATQTGQMTQTTSMSVTAFNGSGASSDYGWNGIGNPSWVSGTVTVNVQVLDPYSYTYQPLTINTNITVSTPFFYNAGGDGSTGSVVMQDAGAGVNYAPARTPANEIKNVAVSFGNEVFRDKIYISASEDALNEYEQDKDLVRMIMSNTPKVAQIFGNAYGMKLSMVNAPMSNNNAEVALTLYAPEAGEYTISVPEMENAEIYLTKDGAIIWNLTMSEYTNDFAKGNNEGYGLLLIKKITGISTGVENIEAAEAGVQKVVIDDKVFILRGEKMYDVTGKMVK